MTEFILDLAMKRSDYEPIKLIEYFEFSLWNQTYANGSFYVDEACLQRCNFRELEANDPDWSKVVVNRDQWQWLQPKKRAYEFAAKAVNISDQSNFVPANLFIYIQLEDSKEFLVAMPIHQTENVQFVQIPTSQAIHNVSGLVGHSLYGS